MTIQRKIPSTMTAAEFIAWPGDGMGGRYQLVDGELRAMSPASTTHGAIQSNLARVIGNHLDVPGGKCRVVTEPAVETRVRANFNRRVPDLGVSCAPDAPGQIELPDPILLIEILSPGNANDTWENVWAYTTIPSVKEIVIVSSTAIEIDVLRRGVDGNWPKEPEKFEGPAASLALASIGLSTPLSAIYSKTYLVG